MFKHPNAPEVDFIYPMDSQLIKDAFAWQFGTEDFFNEYMIAEYHDGVSHFESDPIYMFNGELDENGSVLITRNFDKAMTYTTLDLALEDYIKHQRQFEFISMKIVSIRKEY